ncbi:MAG: T9SS type A sorting domain-containing protein [Bacteroidia bacterium]|nr:T9SS type A sorting domain-containing protein [Bacteroidia bacterium]
MKRLLFMLFALTSIAQAQSLSFPYGKLKHDVIPGVFNDVPIYYKNNTTLPVNIKWEKLSETIYPGWDLNFCNNGNCLPGLPDSGEWKNLQINEEAFIKIHALTNKIEGTSVIKYRIYAVGDPEHADTVTFELVCNIAAGVSSPAIAPINGFVQAGNKLIIQPNTPFATVQVFDLTGRRVFEAALDHGTQVIDLTRLLSGVYIVRVSAGDQLLACRKISLSGN